jgi:sulfite dehydrogenase (quinone) subunit SoeC
VTSGLIAMVLTIAAAVSGMAAVAIERWLFFAEATHTVTLYYGGAAA